jgi:hypothetical protein
VDALDFAIQHDLEIAVRGGGHNVAGRAVIDDGMMIDLSPMKGIYVDPSARRVRVQAGVTWGEFNQETQLHGLATTGGVVSECLDRMQCRPCALGRRLWMQRPSTFRSAMRWTSAGQPTAIARWAAPATSLQPSPDFRDAGVRHFVLDMIGEPEERSPQLEEFANEVMPLLR